MTLEATLDTDVSVPQPGHEYTKGNVKFAASVIQDEATKQLQELATKNKETPGKSTIADEKVCSLFRHRRMRSKLTFHRNTISLCELE